MGRLTFSVLSLKLVQVGIDFGKSRHQHRCRKNLYEFGSFVCATNVLRRLPNKSGLWCVLCSSWAHQCRALSHRVRSFSNGTAVDMSAQSGAATAFPAPSIDVPSSMSIVDVRRLNTTASRKSLASELFNPRVCGFDTFQLPSHSFLIAHNPAGEHVHFDLAIRKDWQTGFPPYSRP